MIRGKNRKFLRKLLIINKKHLERLDDKLKAEILGGC